MATGEDAALKSLCKSEIAALHQLDHEHIVRFVDHDISNTQVIIVMEYCSRGDLRSLLDAAIIAKQVSAPFATLTDEKASLPQRDHHQCFLPIGVGATLLPPSEKRIRPGSAPP